MADASAGGGGRRRDCVVMMDGVVSAGQVGDVQELMGSIDTLSVKERQMSLKKSHQKWNRAISGNVMFGGSIFDVISSDSSASPSR